MQSSAATPPHWPRNLILRYYYAIGLSPEENRAQLVTGLLWVRGSWLRTSEHVSHSRLLQSFSEPCTEGADLFTLQRFVEPGPIMPCTCHPQAEGRGV